MKEIPKRIFRSFDAGAYERTPHSKNRDCQVRALATARSIPYRNAWALLYTIQGERRACEFLLVESLDAKDERFGPVESLSFPAQPGRPRMTPAEFCKKYPRGRFILRMANHVACVKDGQLYDTWDCSRSCVYKAWRVEDAGAAHE